MTNAKTKKIMLGLMNRNPDPVAVVIASRSSLAIGSTQQLGQIVYCNVQFEKMLQERLGIQSVPQSIFRLTKEDDESSKKLRSLIESAVQESNQSPLLQSKHTKKGTRAEIRLAKNVRHPNMQEVRRFDCNIEETKSNHSIITAFNKAQKFKDIFENFEIAEVDVDSVFYQRSSKSVMVTLRVISEQKAKKQLLYLNTISLYRSINNFNKRLQADYSQSLNGDLESVTTLGNMSLKDSHLAHQQAIIESLGSTYLFLSKIQQISYEFHDAALQNLQIDHRSKVSPQSNLSGVEENFLLKEEIM